MVQPKAIRVVVVVVVVVVVELDLLGRPERMIPVSKYTLIVPSTSNGCPMETCK